MQLRAPRGTSDILPGEVERWQWLQQEARTVFTRYGYREIITPVFEHTELFVRGIGEATDVVNKEMYTFTDKGGRSITLRPEGTASVVRAYLEHNMAAWPQPVKLYYFTSGFRYEKPQAGRYRQFHQLGAEALGSADPTLDAEMIAIPIEIYRRLGLGNFLVKLNSIGCPQCRHTYREALISHLTPNLARLCSTCRNRYELNPLRILDCKSAQCQQAIENVPRSVDFLCDD
jgi:histidyl-tRNA synthetase